MKKNMKVSVKSLFMVLVLLLMTVALAACGAKEEAPAEDTADAPELQKMVISHQPQIDTYPTYRMIEEGFDKEAGLELEMMFFDSGMPQIEAIPAHQWHVASTGIVPSLMSALRYDTKILALATDESNAQGVLARADSPVFNTQGAVAEYPNIYGKVEDVKGKTFLCTTVSSGHFILNQYLKAFGLTEADVVVKNLEQAQIMAAFESGEGDFCVLWSPFMYRGWEKGWKMVATGSDVNTALTMVFVADPQLLEENPELVAKYLGLYFDQIDYMKKEGVNTASAVKDYFMDWCAMEITDNDAKLDIETHPMYNLEEQLEMFQSGKIEEAMAKATDFFVAQQKFTPEEAEQLKAKHYGVSDEILKLIAKEKGLAQ